MEMIDMDRVICKMHIEIGEWRMTPMISPTKTAEEFRIFGSTLGSMVTLSTIESWEQHGNWRIE